MRNLKSSYNNNKLKISAPPWNDKFELPDGSYSVSNIQDCFEYILKKKLENIDNPSVKIYVNKIENRFTFRIRNGYRLELLTPETIKLLGSTENKITKDKNSKNVPHLEITFVPNKSLGSLLEMSPTNHIFLKPFKSEFQDIEVWFLDQNSKPLEIEDRINSTSVIK